MTLQLPLRLTLCETATFENFYPGDNVAIIDALKSGLNHQGESIIYLWGHPGVGRSHLLQACCHYLQDQAGTVMYLPLRSTQLAPPILQDIENRDLICIDDIDAVLGKVEWEEALLHFYNRAHAQNRCVIIVGNELPARLSMHLADLQSRLSWGLVFHVAALSDEQKIKALQIRAQERGIELVDEVGHFLLHHYPRDMTALFNLLDKLDRASLSERRKITVPFVRQVLGG